jgi:hypothetical protein
MLLEQETICACRTSNLPVPRTHNPSIKVVYIVTDTCYSTSADFNDGKGNTTIDSVHTTAGAANIRAKKIMFARNSPGSNCEVDEDRIIEEHKGGLYTGVGIGGTEKYEFYARKCEVEVKPLDIDEDGSSEEEHDGEGWSVQ